MTTLPAIDVDAFSLSKSSAYKELYFPRKILKAEIDVSTHRYFIIVVFVVDDDTLLGLLVLRPSISSLLQTATAFLLQSATGITKCDNFITKCDRYYKDDYYKVRQYIVYLARCVTV